MTITTVDTFPSELDDLALASPQATFYHTGVWLESVAAAYPRLSLRCIVAREGAETLGYLPYFVSTRGPLRRIWSLPFGTYGGPVAREEAVARALLQHYERLRSAAVVEVGWVDFQNIVGAREDDRWYETHLVDLSAGFDDLWSTKFDKQRRKRARRAERLGVTVRRCDDVDGRRAYFNIFRARIEAFGRRNLYPESLHDELFARGGDAVRLYLARHEDTVVGGHLNFYHKDTVIAWNGIVAEEHEHLQAGTLLYAECMRDACREGLRTYNLGASLGKTSLIYFKESLGGVAHGYAVHASRSLLGRIVRRARAQTGDH
jgi:CelD/BcsL family acetyltransferase involved in cellulose biosynthesis